MNTLLATMLPKPVLYVLLTTSFNYNDLVTGQDSGALGDISGKVAGVGNSTIFILTLGGLFFGVIGLIVTLIMVAVGGTASKEQGKKNIPMILIAVFGISAAVSIVGMIYNFGQTALR